MTKWRIKRILEVEFDEKTTLEFPASQLIANAEKLSWAALLYEVDSKIISKIKDMGLKDAFDFLTQTQEEVTNSSERMLG